MTLTDAEFRGLLDDASKRIQGDIAWQDDEDHSPSVEPVAAWEQFCAEARLIHDGSLAPPPAMPV